MTNQVQTLRRIGACENRQAQADWKGPEIPPCSEPASYVCDTCARLLCGGHAAGHAHATASPAALASHFQEEAAGAARREAEVTANAEKLEQQLASAQAAAGMVEKIKEMVG